jgi:hypothetical protein
MVLQFNCTLVESYGGGLRDTPAAAPHLVLGSSRWKVLLRLFCFFASSMPVLHGRQCLGTSSTACGTVTVNLTSLHCFCGRVTGQGACCSLPLLLCVAPAFATT